MLAPSQVEADCQWISARRAAPAQQAGPWLTPAVAFVLLLFVRGYSARRNLVHDCDEVYNYWEPLHFTLYGHGFQTWEYRCCTLHCVCLPDFRKIGMFPVPALQSMSMQDQRGQAHDSTAFDGTSHETRFVSPQLSVRAALVAVHPAALARGGASRLVVRRRRWQGGSLRHYPGGPGARVGAC